MSLLRDTHGTYSRYVKGKCRCAECSRANREYQNARNARLSEARKAAAEPGEHKACAECGMKLVAGITPEQWEAHKRLRHG